MVYLTHYTEYPIYEPAEGGYYYTGREAGESYKFETEAEAIQMLSRMKADLEYEGFTICEDYAFLDSKYIGGGEQWYIEEVYGSRNSGWHPYE